MKKSTSVSTHVRSPISVLKPKVVKPVRKKQKLTDSKKNQTNVHVTLPKGIAPYNINDKEEYMGEPQVEHFKQILLAWQQELMEEVDRTVNHLKSEPINSPDMNDRATQEEEFALELRTRDRERKLLKKISKSLKDIGDGEYGFCKACGIEIGIRRLEARPTAELCIDCKTLSEIKEKQTGLPN